MCVGLGLTYRKYRAKYQIELAMVSAEVRDTCHRVKDIRPNLQQNSGVAITPIIFVTTSNTVAVLFLRPPTPTSNSCEQQRHKRRGLREGRTSMARVRQHANDLAKGVTPTFTSRGWQRRTIWRSG